MPMWKKALVALIVLAFMAIAWTPWWTTRMAERGFDNPRSPGAPRMIARAIRIKLAIWTFAEAQRLAEKGIIYFPESAEFGQLMLDAAVAAKKQDKYRAAVFWYEEFVRTFPKHKMAPIARNEADRLIEMHNLGGKKKK